MRDVGLVGARSGDGIVRVLEDVVLSTVAEIVEVIVSGWGECTLVHLIIAVRVGPGVRWVNGGKTHVVSFLLEPVEGVLGAVCAVTGRRVHNAVSWISTASARDLWRGQGNGRGRSGHVALESGHIIYNPTNEQQCMSKHVRGNETHSAGYRCRKNGSKTRRNGTLPEGTAACWQERGNR